MPFTYPAVFPWLALALGLLLGSFYNVCIHRSIEGQSLLWPPSHCPHCAARLRPSSATLRCAAAAMPAASASARATPW